MCVCKACYQPDCFLIRWFCCPSRRSLWKHFRAVSLCLFLLIFPAYMAFMICQFFHTDFWLLIIISSSILTSLQVTHNRIAVCKNIKLNSLNLLYPNSSGQ